MSDSVLITGRGPSVYRYDWVRSDMPVMAVSSGVFGIPETVMPEHFVTLDEPKFFLDSLAEHSEIAWQNDGNVRFWPFWRYPEVEKHVYTGRVRHGKYRQFPNVNDVMDSIPEEHHKSFLLAMAGKIHEFGLQPGWADWPTVTGWELDLKSEPNFTPEGKFGLDSVNNSLFFAVQVAVRLGYRHLHFVGVDLHGEHYELHRDTLKRWMPQAEAEGVTFTNLGEGSALADMMPVMV